MRLVLFVFLVLVSIAGGAAKYVPANDSLPLLRRDLLPLDVDAIRDLAEHLAILADGPAPKSASQYRHRLQLLTLSQRLAPAQPRARAVENALKAGEERPGINGIEIKTAKREVLAAADWLARLPEHSEGRHLGQLLLDILQPIAGKDPLLKMRDAANALKRWQGVVADVKDFEGREDPAQPLPAADPIPEPPSPKTGEATKFAVTGVLTEVPMIAVGLTEGEVPVEGLIKTSLVITDAGEEGGTLRFQPDTGFEIRPLQEAIGEFFATHSKPLPSDSNLNVNTSGKRYLAVNQENITAPLAMMLDAAVTGRSLRRNTIFFARLRADGSLAKPAKPWELILHLDQLRMPQGTRLIVGSGMIEEFTAILVMEKPDFFTKYEVIEAPTFEKARDLFYEDGTPPPALAAAINGYQVVRSKAQQANNLKSFLSLESVEVRLVKARDQSPYHLSARMLATQAIRRPASFTRFMFAQELDRRLEEISNFQYEIDKSPIRSIKDAHKKAREAIDSMERMLQRAEIEVLKSAVDILRQLNSVGRGASTLLDNEEEVRQADLAKFQKELQAFRNKLREIYQPAENK